MLPQDLLREIHTAALNASLDRKALLAGIDPTFVARLHEGTSPANQIWLDLQELNRTRALGDGSVPIHTWLNTALYLAGPRREAQPFHQALEALARPPAPALQGALAPPAGTIEAPRIVPHHARGRFGLLPARIGSQHLVTDANGRPEYFTVRDKGKHPNARTAALCLHRNCTGKRWPTVAALLTEHAPSADLVERGEAHVFALWSEDPATDTDTRPLGLLDAEL